MESSGLNQIEDCAGVVSRRKSKILSLKIVLLEFTI
jgi:hypothetical protein